MRFPEQPWDGTYGKIADPPERPIAKMSKENATLPQAEHTIGPWHIGQRQTRTEISGFSLIRPERADFAPLAYVASEADARLIAAAPELLEACKAAVPLLDDYVQGQRGCDVADQLHAVIAKAEGR